jgi:flagellar hook-associated protein 3 FlgL
MRISTTTMYEQGIARISEIQAQQVKLQEQISTGKKFNSPSEDPIGAARALELTRSKETNDNYANIRKTAENSLTILESNLDSVTNLMLSAQSQLVAAGNGALSNLERGFIANELQNTLDSMVALGNAQDASGKYLYSGFSTNTKPFVLNGGTNNFDYMASNGSIKLEVASNQEMPVNFAGNQVFQNGTDAFTTLQDIITLLNTPITDAATQATYNNGLATAIDGMKSSLDNVLNVRATIGGRLNQLDELNVAGSALDLQYQSALSDVQDLDYAQALSDFTKTQTLLEAAQKTFSSTVKLSLFDFI